VDKKMPGRILCTQWGLKTSHINFYTKSMAHGSANCHCRAISGFLSGDALTKLMITVVDNWNVSVPFAGVKG
jgi:hypothetical protein